MYKKWFVLSTSVHSNACDQNQDVVILFIQMDLYDGRPFSVYDEEASIVARRGHSLL